MVKKYKKEDMTSYAMGATVVMELLNKKPNAVKRIYVSPKSNVAAVAARAAELGTEMIESERAFNILGAKGNCFCIAEFEKFETGIDAARNHIVLVNPSDSGNLGTIIRVAAAFDCAELAIITPAVDIFDPKTVRASMGALFDIHFALFDGFEEYTEFAGEREIVPFMLSGAPLSQKTFSRDKKYSLVFGNEATGLPDGFARYGAVRIEQSDKVDSLNLSVAAAIGIYKLSVS